MSPFALSRLLAVAMVMASASVSFVNAQDPAASPTGVQQPTPPGAPPAPTGGAGGTDAPQITGTPTDTDTSTSGLPTFPATPLVSKHFEYPGGLPYKADTDVEFWRGRQIGYNICNSTTEGQTSQCQTSLFNSIDDFCLWGGDKVDSTVGIDEVAMVAWCTKPGHGTRLIPEGTFKGVQFMKTPDYVQVIAYIDQSKINIKSGDFGGELDPHGADLRGNPLGGLMYSNAFGPDKNKFEQVIEWHNFIGFDFTCFKVCDPAGPNAAHYCEHIYDRIGCTFNAPNRAQNGTFESCEGESQDFPGVYTVGTTVMTYTQPPESLGEIKTLPYTPRIPASSNCVTYKSEELFSAIATVQAAGVTAAPSATKGTAGTAQTTASKNHSSSGDAGVVVRVSVVSILGAVIAAVFFS